ncbi:MAG: hypothetical protein E6248_03685 [Clostridium sp.]|uniref:hypothetical protein n=1 Tax=Clostridium sp. TaxID=1506 RepID=UPI00291577CF|nr:hypothetical protein [Clostridium sp.]MDU5109522.1 hypothetical protein [Clostridium sp.]
MRVIFKSFNEPTVTDENGKEIISFEKSKALPTRECYSVINSNNEKIGKIERIRNNFGLFDLPRIVISVNNDKIIIRKDIKEFKDIYEITGNGFSILGNLDGPHFNISESEKVIASVTVEKEELGQRYLADIIDKSTEKQVICILFALSWIM